MKKILFLIMVFLSISNTSYAKTYSEETGQEITLTQTTDGYMAFSDQINANIENLKKHTVIVKLVEGEKQYRAAGIAIDKRHILTVSHITSETGKNFYRSTDGGVSYWATVVKRDPSHDLSLLEIEKNAPDLIAEPITYASNITAGETIYTIGHPDNYYELTTGTVDSESDGWNGIKGYMLNANIKNGNSGGFAINENGEIIGMVFSKSKLLNNICYMIGKDDIQDFIK